MTEIREWTKDSLRERMEEIAIEDIAKRQKAKAAKATRPGKFEECEITAVARKIRDNHSGNTRWEQRPCSPFKGEFIGYRFKYNGRIVPQGEWEQNGFVQEETVEVWLFLTNLRHDPEMAFPADVKRGQDNG